VKLKNSQLEEIIKEEIYMFRKHHGGFVPYEENEAIPGTLADDEQPLKIVKGEPLKKPVIKNDVRQMISRLMDNLGADKLVYELVSRVDERALKPVLETLIKLYNIRYD